MSDLALAKIRIDGGTQPRSKIDEAVIAEYASAMEAGAKFPPIAVFFDGIEHWLADGFHRYHAANAAHLTELEACIFNGTRRDAVLHSVGANTDHGLRRTNEDKRRAIKTLLDDPEWTNWSDSEIGRRCGVSHDMVGRMRPPSLAQNASEKTYTTKHGTVATMKTENIGKRQFVDAMGRTQTRREGHVEQQGLSISKHKTPNSIGSVSSLMRVYKRSNADTLGRALRIIRDAYGETGFEASVIDGIGHLCQRYNGALDEQSAKNRLGSAHGGVKGLLNRASTLQLKTGNSKSMCIAAAAVDIINTGKGGKKLPNWWKGD